MYHQFKKLTTWNKAMDLTDIAYNFCKDLPASERFNLIDQIKRSSCSIPSNIAEGSGKRTSLQFAEYLSISISSAYDLETHLLICERRNYGKKDVRAEVLMKTVEVEKMLFSFREKILKSK